VLTAARVALYERGVTRVGAAQLFSAARTFGIAVTIFFEGLA
jgi:hypothetical protein